MHLPPRFRLGVALFAIVFFCMTFVRSEGTAYNGTPGNSGNERPLNGVFDWLVIRCHAKNDAEEPQSTDYFAKLFTQQGAGTFNLVDYWHDVSYGNVVMQGDVANGGHTDAKGWYTMPITLSAYNALSRPGQIQACANMAAGDYNFGGFYGVITIYPGTDSGASGGDSGYGPTQIQVSSGSFTMAQENFPSNVNLTFAAHETGHGLGLHHSRTLSRMPAAYFDDYDIMSAMATDSFTPPSNDSHDATYGGQNLGSLTSAKGPGPDAVTLADEGWLPGNRISRFLGVQRTFRLHALTDPKGLGDSPAGVAAGGDGQILEAVTPASHTFPFSPTPDTCTSNSYTLEYREPLGWDAGIASEASYWSPASQEQLNEIGEADFPIGSVVMHLVCVSGWDPPPASYNYSILVDAEPNGGAHKFEHNPNFYSSGGPAGAYFPGDEYGDNLSSYYVAVNQMSTSGRYATVTIASQSGAIDDRLTSLGPDVAASSGEVDASVHFETHQPAAVHDLVAPIPGHVVKFTVKDKSCSAVTDLDGVATCSLPVSGHIGNVFTYTATTAATRAYRAASTSGKITILPTAPPSHHKERSPRIEIHRPAPPVPPPGQGV